MADEDDTPIPVEIRRWWRTKPLSAMGFFWVLVAALAITALFHWLAP